MSDISENVSEIRRRRGRPPRYSPTDMALACHTFIDVLTVRGQQNKACQLHAHAVLRDEPGLEWLIDKDGIMHRKPGAYRQTLLQELGRIEDVEVMKAVARQLCERKPTTREAVAMIRHFRLG